MQEQATDVCGVCRGRGCRPIGAGGRERQSGGRVAQVLSEQLIKAVDQGVEIKSEGGRREKDVKQVRLSVDGADVQITKAVPGWDNRGDDTITDIGVLKAGG